MTDHDDPPKFEEHEEGLAWLIGYFASLTAHIRVDVEGSAAVEESAKPGVREAAEADADDCVKAFRVRTPDRGRWDDPPSGPSHCGATEGCTAATPCGIAGCGG